MRTQIERAALRRYFSLGKTVAIVAERLLARQIWRSDGAARVSPAANLQMSPKNAGTKLEEQFDELPDFLRQLFEFAEAVNHEGHFLAGFDRLVSRDFAGSDFADLRIPGGFKLSYKLL